MVTNYARVTLFVGFSFLYLCTQNLVAYSSTNSYTTSFKLANGLRVILSQKNDIDATCLLLYHLTGIRDDPLEIQGASYLYKNLMQLGTQNFENYHQILFIKENGGNSERVVGYDRSIFSQVVPASEINNALWHESERISSLKLIDSNIKIEKNSVYSKNYKLLNSSVHVRASNWVKSNLFEGTIYSAPVYGTLHEIVGFDNQAVRKIYKNFKNLSNIILVISGKFDISSIKKSINKYFGQLKSTPGKIKYSKNNISVKPRNNNISKNWMEENISGPFLLLGILGPAKNNLDFLYFDFLRYYLVDERISKLEEILNQEHHLNIMISYESIDYFEASALIIKISTLQRANFERARYFLNKKLESLQKGTLPNAEIKNTRSLMEIDFLKDMTDLKSKSIFLAESFYFSGDLNGERNRLRRIRNINTYDIFRIARKYLKKGNQVNLNVFPKK